MILEPVIGLEIHVQLKTKSKMFCSCDNDGESKPINTTVCEICMGHPGTLPSTNRIAVQWTVKSAIALQCAIPHESKFDRKHYFYPDLPKGYQISQYDQPLGIGGFLLVKTDRKAGAAKDGFIRVGIHRVHLEEDAAKLLHPRDGWSVVDFNRAGTPLMEIVTEPDMRTSVEAGNFLRELRLLMRALRVSDADMEKGHLRADANISMRPEGDSSLHSKTEIKNLNSFRSVERAIEFEMRRQKRLWEEGSPPKVSSTRGWDQDKGETIEQREKEEAHDYRYFPEPDIPPVKLKPIGSSVHLQRPILETDSLVLEDGAFFIDVGSLTREIPEVPQAKRFRFMKEYDLDYENAAILSGDAALASFFEKAVSELKAWLITLENMDGTEEDVWDANRKKLCHLASGFLVNKLCGLSALHGSDFGAIKITPEDFAELVALFFEKRVNSSSASAILELMHETGKDPHVILEEKGLSQIDDEEALEKAVDGVIAANFDVVASYKNGKENAIQFLVGDVMKATKGKANPAMVLNLLKKRL